MTIPAVQLAKDFITLRGILSEDRYRYSNELVGPDLNHLPITSCLKEEIPQVFSANATAYLERCVFVMMLGLQIFIKRK